MSADGQRPLALAADHDASERQAAIEAFDKIGFDACTAVNGEEALAAFERHQPELVLLAYDMPDIDGPTLCHAIRDMPGGGTLPIVMIGDVASDIDIETAYQAGITDFLPRPRNWTLATHRLRYLVRTNRAEAELAQTHKLLAQAIDLFPGSFTVYDPNGRLRIANQPFRRVIPGLQIGMTFEEVSRKSLDTGLVDFRGRTREEWTAYQRERMESGDWWVLDLTDGRTIRQVCSRLDDGSFFVLAIDVTEEKRNERILLAAKREAEAANRIKAQFLAGMSHELRTPLNAIIGFSDIIQKEMMGNIENRSYVEYAADINRSGNSLLDSLTLILDLSKLESGQRGLQDEEFEAADVVAVACRRYSERAQEKNIIILSQGAPNVTLRGDALRIGRALQCLLDNAIKFSPSNSTVQVSVHSREDGIEIRVRDHGIGMEETDLPQAFSMFSQINQTPAREFSGLGMGLTYAKTLMDAHGGRLVVDSQLGAGTAMGLLLPPDRVVGIEAPALEAKVASSGKG